MANSLSTVFGKHGIVLKEDELAHAGVKGMRWGHRKRAKAEAKAAAANKPSIRSMSDDELRNAINRIKMEREFVKLTTPEVSKGRKIVSNILMDVGQTQSKAFLNQVVVPYAAKAVVSAAKKSR